MRTRLHRSLFGVALIGALFVLQSGLAATLAQDAPSQVGPVKPSPTLCTLEPRTADELRTLFSSATPTDPMGMSTTATIVFGQPANQAAAEQVTSVIHQAFACLNAGDYGRFLALMTDRVILSSFSWMKEMLGDETSSAQAMNPQPVPDEFQQTLLGVGSVSRLPDGRHSAVVVGIDPNAGEYPFALYLVFTEQDGTWLIDEVVDFDMAE